MAPDRLRQLVLFLYEYFYNNEVRFENEYLSMLNKHYIHMTARYPERYLQDLDMLELIQKKAHLEMFLTIQKDIYDILNLYRPTSGEFDSFKK